MKALSKPLILGLALAAFSGCVEDLYTDPDELEAETEREVAALLNGDTGAVTGGRYTIEAAGQICNSTCSVGVAGNNFQVATQCDAARSAYNVYRQNAEVFNDPVAQGCEEFNGQTFCVSRSDLDTLLSQYRFQQDLANETFQRIGCGGG